MKIDEKFEVVGETLSHFPHTFFQLLSNIFYKFLILKSVN